MDPLKSGKPLSTTGYLRNVIRTTNVPLIFLFAVAAATRLWRLEFPRLIIFDELFYSRFVNMYINNIFFFDSNPPFAKQLIAATAYAAGYRHQNETYTKIGDPYAPDTPLWSLRIVPAVFGSLLVPVSYGIIRDLGYSKLAAYTTALCFLFDNALVTGSRFVMMDSVNICLLLLAVFSVLKFIHSHPLSVGTYVWGPLAGVFMGLSISTKYLSFSTILLLGWIIARNYWKTIDDLTLSAWQLLKYLALCVSIVLVIPSFTYLGCFFVHLAVLTKAGPYDTMMSSRFQASLEGGLAAISMGQPYNVVYGSQVTLRNGAGVKDTACWLHSHKEVYPMRYADGRGSSHQQQVTCYSYKDVNNWWIVKHPNKTILEVESPPEFVKDGSIIQLVHGITGRVLNSHDVAAPFTPECQEVSCYIDYNISMQAQDLWQVRIINQEPEDRLWHTIQTQVQLIHINSSTVLTLTNQQLPAWAYNQFEVAASLHHGTFTLSLWNVEEHRYTRPHADDKDRESVLAQAEFLPDKPVSLSLWKKFLELQYSMLGLSRDTVEEHVYGSKPLDWILNDNGVAFWAEKGTNRQIYQLGNQVIWHSGAAALLISTISLLILNLWHVRYPDAFPLDSARWRRLGFTAEVVLCGFAINWLPFFFTDRTLFFHHYYPALVFKILLLGCFIGEALTTCQSKSIMHHVTKPVLGAWMLSVVYTFYRFIPLTYGFSELSAGQLHELEWRETWNFIIRN